MAQVVRIAVVEVSRSNPDSGLEGLRGQHHSVPVGGRLVEGRRELSGGLLAIRGGVAVACRTYAMTFDAAAGGFRCGAVVCMFQLALIYLFAGLNYLAVACDLQG